MLIEMNFENIKLKLKLIGVGDYEFILNRYIAPLSIDEVFHKCPLKSRGVKRNGKLTLLTSLKLSTLFYTEYLITLLVSCVITAFKISHVYNYLCIQLSAINLDQHNYKC